MCPTEEAGRRGQTADPLKPFIAWAPRTSDTQYLWLPGHQSLNFSLLKASCYPCGWIQAWENSLNCRTGFQKAAGCSLGRMNSCPLWSDVTFQSFGSRGRVWSQEAIGRDDGHSEANNSPLIQEKLDGKGIPFSARKARTKSGSLGREEVSQVQLPLSRELGCEAWPRWSSPIGTGHILELGLSSAGGRFRARCVHTGGRGAYNIWWNHIICFCLKKNSTEWILKVLLTLFNHSWMRQHPISHLEGSADEVYKMKGFYRQKGTGPGSY